MERALLTEFDRRMMAGPEAFSLTTRSATAPPWTWKPGDGRASTHYPCSRGCALAAVAKVRPVNLLTAEPRCARRSHPSGQGPARTGRLSPGPADAVKRMFAVSGFKSAHLPSRAGTPGSRGDRTHRPSAAGALERRARRTSAMARPSAKFAPGPGELVAGQVARLSQFPQSATC